MKTIVLLTFSNVFMTLAWYGHLKLKWFHGKPVGLVILASWGIAFFEYCLMVPANRAGYGRFSAYELKIVQEIITLSVFPLFAFFVMREKLAWNYLVSFALVALAAWFAFGFRTSTPPHG